MIPLSVTFIGMVQIRHLQGEQVSQQILSFYPVTKQGMELYKMSQGIQFPATHNSRALFNLPTVLMELAGKWKPCRYLGEYSQFVMFPLCPDQAKFLTRKLSFIQHHISKC